MDPEGESLSQLRMVGRGQSKDSVDLICACLVVFLFGEEIVRKEERVDVLAREDCARETGQDTLACQQKGKERRTTIIKWLDFADRVRSTLSKNEKRPQLTVSS